MKEYLWVAFFLLVGIAFCLGGFIFNWFIRSNKPSESKLSTYECGEKPVGSAWIQYDVKYYLYGLLFLIFDVEIVFIIPWATIFKGSATVTALFVEMVIFIVILLVGLIYAGKKGALQWR
ncbi:MAG: NADH-quinone oxidoreductase subunit A [bacterium]|nr:NADH-quinone oxidoreductase subunit A [bacterium]